MAGRVRVGDTLAGRNGEHVRISAITVDVTETEVFNLEIDGTFTFFVEGTWVHNNSCPNQLDIWRGRHGAQPHVGGGQGVLDDLVARGIPEEQIRWNQSLVSPGGQHFPGIRPDIQYIDDNGLVHVIEIVNTSAPSSGRREQVQQALGPYFGGYEVRYVGGP